MKKAVLVRVGIDSTKESGKWNAPVNPDTWEFAYVPVLEDEGRGKGVIKKKPIRAGYEITYEQFKKPYENLGRVLKSELLEEGKFAHLDPDFRYLTYGDAGNKGAHLKNLYLEEDDILAFYAALAPPDVERKTGKLIYALIGLYRLKGPGVLAKDIIQENWYENAHTRREPNDDDKDIVFHGKRDEGVSGRLERCIPIGEYRSIRYYPRYYLESEIQNKWGEPRPIYIQRGSHDLCDPDKFYEWFQEQKQKLGIRLVKENNSN